MSVTCRVVGHRGAPRVATENTLAAIEAAAGLGADGVEIDVRRSADDVAVVIHDATVDRTTTRSGPVDALEAAVLGALGVPTLAGVVDLCRDLGLWLNIEVKEVLEPIGAALAITSLGAGGVVSSFMPDALTMVSEVAPHLERALLTVPGIDPADGIAAARTHHAWNPHMSTVLRHPEAVAEAGAAGLDVHVWTVNEPDHLRAMAAAGVASVITDVPGVALALFGR